MLLVGLLLFEQLGKEEVLEPFNSQGLWQLFFSSSSVTLVLELLQARSLA